MQYKYKKINLTHKEIKVRGKWMKPGYMKQQQKLLDQICELNDCATMMNYES